MRPRFSAINILSVSIFGAGVLAFVYLVIIRPSLSSNGNAQVETTPSTSEPPDEMGGQMLVSVPPNSADQLLFISRRDGNAEIYRITLDGSAPVRLTTSDADERAPRWSPDGRAIAFIADRDAINPRPELYIMNSDGSAQTMLASGVGPVAQAEWSPDGSQIALSMADSEGYLHLYLISPSGGEMREIWKRVTDDFAWSPDGQSIVLAGLDVDAGVTETTIYVLEIATGAFRSISEPGAYGVNARWSLDGRTISFTKGAVPQPNGNDLYVADVLSGEPPRRITSGLNIEFMEWSPDGRYLAFTGLNANNSTSLYRASAATGEIQALATTPHLAPLSWSPDGKHIAVDTRSATGSEPYNIMIVDVETGYTTIVETLGDAEEPQWSPVLNPAPSLTLEPTFTPSPLPTPVTEEAATETPPTQEATLDTANQFSIIRSEVWPDPAEQFNPTTTVGFGQRISFQTSIDLKVLLIAFPLYSDEVVPAETECMARNGSMPDAHPDRSFWSAGFPTEYEEYGLYTYEQEYQFTQLDTGVTHFISWLVIRNEADQVVWCNQVVYALYAP